LSDLDAVGVKFDCVTWQLENEGVQKFIDPFDALMQMLNEKSQRLLSREASS
jgi:hypothetical protein